MKFSYSAVWNETMRLIRAHGSLIAALAGVFIFLPALLIGHFLPQPQPEDATRVGPLLIEYVEAYWPWLLLQRLVNMTGAIAILRLAFPRGGSTLGGVIVAAAALLPFYFLASVLTSLAIGIGFVLLILPGLYLFGRLAPTGPVMVAEERRNPIDAIRRAWQLTSGHGWAVLGLLVVVAIAGIIVMIVFNNILGTILILAAGQNVGLFLSLIVTSASAAAFATLFTILYAAIYRHLEPSDGVQ